ncbi:MAG: S26 family signal peptidase [Myxococcales bacterium FL481]|nr:MAG: S26 family signal peptidase [Myxococcales bacterium FL481]
MWPALKRGDQIEVAGATTMEPTADLSQVVVGSIVVARHPFVDGQLIVKRVTAICGDRVALRGDNWIESQDSAAFGSLGIDQIIGVVVAVERPPARAASRAAR